MSALPASAEKVQDAAAALGLAIAVREMTAPTRTAEEAARACGVTVGQIVKSLVFSAAATGKPLLLLVSGKNRVDEQAVATVISASRSCARTRPSCARRQAMPSAAFRRSAMRRRSTLTWIATCWQNDVIWAAAGMPKAVFRDGAGEVARGDGRGCH